MAEHVIPLAASVAVLVYKVGEVIVKKSYKKINYKRIKRSLYNNLTKNVENEDIEKIKEYIDLLSDFDLKNGKEKLPKLLNKLNIDINKISTLEEISSQFEEKHNKESEKSVILDEINEYFDIMKKDFITKINQKMIKE